MQEAMSNSKSTYRKAKNNISYMAWFCAASAEYCDLDLTREQLVCLHRECLEVAKIQNDFDLNAYSCFNSLPLIYEISARQGTIGYCQEAHQLAKLHGNTNLEMVMSISLAAECITLDHFNDSIFYGEESLSIAKKIGDKNAEKIAYLLLLKMHFALKRHEEGIVYSKLWLEVVSPERDDRNVVAFVYYCIGNAYHLLNEYDDAIFYTKKCIEVEVGEVVSTMNIKMNPYQQLAYIYQSLNCHEDVIHFSKKSIEMSKVQKDENTEMEARLLLSHSYLETKRYNDSLLCTQKVIKATRITCNKEVEMAACITRARSYISLKQYDDAIIWGKKCIDWVLNQIFGTIYGRNHCASKEVVKKGRVAMMAGYLVLAEAHLNLYEHTDCILSSKKAIPIAKKLKDQKAERKGYLTMGQAYQALHQYDECILYWERCIEIAEETDSDIKANDFETTMLGHMQLGQIYFYPLKDYNKAMLHFQTCIEIANELGNLSFKMLASLKIAMLHYCHEDFENAILHIEKCLTIAVGKGDKNVEAECYMELGMTNEFKKNYDDAILFSNKAIEIAKQIGNKVVEMNAYLVIAKIQNTLKKHDDAIFFIERCNDTAKGIKDPNSGHVHYQLSKTYFDAAKRYEEAILHSNECIAIANRTGNRYLEMKAYLLLGGIYNDLKQYDNVAKYTEKSISIAIETKEKKDEMNAYLLLGQAYHFLLQYDDSIRNLYKCLEIAMILGETLVEMRTYLLLGNTLLSCGETTDALLYSEKCLNIALEMGEKETEMNIYMTQGDAYFDFEEHEEAILYYTKCLGISKGISDRKTEMVAYKKIGDIYLGLKKQDDATLYVNKSLVIAQETGERVNEMIAYIELGNAYFDKNLYDDAIQYSKKCLTTSRKTGEETNKTSASQEERIAFCGINDESIDVGKMRAIQIRAYTVLVKSYYALNKHDAAYFCTQKCMDIMNQMKDKHNSMTALLYICQMYESIQNFEDAIYYGKQCARLAIKTGDKLVEKDSYCILRDLFCNVNAYRDYLVYSRKCLQIVKLHGTHKNEMYALFYLGDSFSCLRQYEDAIPPYEKCIEIAEESEKHERMKAFLHLANSYYNLAKYKDSIPYYKACIDIAKEVSNSSVQMDALLSSAYSFMSLNQYNEAYSQMSEGLEIAKTLEDNVSINQFNSLLRVFYEEVGMNEKIVVKDNELEPSLTDIDNPTKNNSCKFMKCFNRYSYHRDRNEYQQAIAWLKEGMIVEESDGNGDLDFTANFTLILKPQIAQMYVLLGEYDTGLRYFQEGLALALKFENKHYQALCRWHLGEIYYMLEQNEKSEESLREAIKCFEFMFDHLGNNDQFKISIVDKYIEVFKLLLKIIIVTNRKEEALLLSDHIRARALKDLLISNYGITEAETDNMEPLEYSDVQALVEKYCILLYSTCLGKLYRFIVEPGIKLQLSVCDTEYCSRLFDAIIEKSFSEMNVREVVNCEDRCLDIVSNLDIKQNLNSSQKELRGSTIQQEKFCSSCSSRSPGEPSANNEISITTNTLEILYQRLLTNMCHVKQDEIVIIPEGPLFKVPFAALRDPVTGQYISETKRIRLAPSIITLKLLQSCPPDYYPTSGAIIIGDPLVGKVMMDGEEKEFERLLGALEEAVDIALILMVPPLLAQEATKPAVIKKLQQGASVVHIAAHGSLTKGAIALAPSPEIRATKIPEEEDYMLTMADVQKAQVRAQLVVLSCCHSGRGEIRAEGVVGMCRAFLASGARAVLASLWAINDQATLEFMNHFYSYLKQGKSASTSLHLTMEDMRQSQEYSEPKYWAAFFLMGDDVTIQFQ